MARHLEESSVLQPECTEFTAPDATRIQGQVTFFQAQAEGSPVTKSDGHFPGFAVPVPVPGPVGGWLRTRRAGELEYRLALCSAKTDSGQDVAD